MGGIIGELGQSIITRALAFLGDGNVGSYMGVLDAFEVLHRSIGRIASDLFGLDAPTEQHRPEEVKHRVIVHHFAWHDQYPQDDATFASIHHVVRMVAQVGSTSLEAHWGSI